MKVYNVEQVRPYSVAELKDDMPSRKGVKMIDEDTIVKLNGEVIAVYKKIPYDISPLRAAALYLDYPTYVRTSGLVTHTEGINASPRNPTRTYKCSFSKMSQDHPDVHQVFLDYAKKIAQDYKKYFPKQYAGQIKQTYVGKIKVEKDYIVPGTSFTGGVVNKNSRLGFHLDSANTAEGISCMYCLKKGLTGGELVLPELGIGFECQDGYMLLFDGKKYIHGVVPFREIPGRKGYRVTIVYYNSKGMSICLPPVEEEEHYKKHLEKKTALNFKQNDNER